MNSKNNIKNMLMNLNESGYLYLKQKLREHLKIKSRKMWKDNYKEYDNPNYWKVEWLKEFFIQNKIKRYLQERLVKDLGFLPPYDKLI